MESNKPNEDDNPPPSTSPLQQHVNINHSRADNSGILHNANNSGSDFVEFPYMTVPFTPPWNNMNGSYPPFMQEFPASGDYPMADLMRHNTYQNPQFDLNFTDIRTDIPLVTLSGIANPGEIHQSVNRDFMMNPDGMMNCSVDYGSFQNSPMNGNFTLPAESSNDNSQLIDRNLPNLRGSESSGCYPTQKSEDTQMVDNNVDVNSNQFGRLGKIDGSFLSLGTGCNEGSRSKSTFSKKEIASQLNSSHVPQTTTRDFSSLGYNLNSGVSSSQGNGSGLERSVNNLAGWAPNNSLNSTAFHNLQAQEVNMQHNMSMSSNMNPGFVSKRPVAYVDLDPESSFGDDQCASSRAFVVNKPNELHGFGQFGSTPESANGANRVQNYYMRPKNISAGSSMVSPIPGLTNQNHPGQLVSTHDGSVAQAQVPMVTGGTFPKRLGFQDGNHQAAGVKVSNGMGVQSGKVGPSQKFSGPIHSPRNVVGSPTSIGRPRGTAPYQLPVTSHGPSSSTGGQLQNDVPSHSAKNLHRIPASTPGGEYVNKVVKRPVGRPPLKRGAIRPPAGAPTSRRSKPTLKAPQHSPLPRPIPVSTIPHIKWQVPQEVCEPIKEKCMLCKRGLSFAPEGEMHQPATPLPVAVLPCGHTFHDYCLERITPRDQAKDPPCIPCAMGEN